MPERRPWTADGGGAPVGGSRALMRKPAPLGRVGDEGAVVVLAPVVARKPPQFCSWACPVGPTTYPLPGRRVGRGGGFCREKSLTGGVGHGVGDVLDAVFLLGGDVEAYSSHTLPDRKSVV